MKAHILKFLVLIFMFSCKSERRKQDDDIKIDTLIKEDFLKETVQSISSDSSSSKNVLLKDSTINGIQLNFIQISKEKYESLLVNAIETKIPFQNFNHVVVKTKDCQLVKIGKSKIDSLCDIHPNDQSSYHQTYTIKGLWKEKNQLLVNYSDWEDSEDYLINLNDGSRYHLSSEYKMSPDYNFMLGYTKSNLIPLYGNNEFMYSKISNDSIQTLFKIDFGDIIIINLKWLKDSKCIISTGTSFIESNQFKLKDDKYYLMTIKN